MHLRFTNHAKAGMYERRIEASRIADTIRRPILTKPAGDGAIAYYRTFGSKTLRVVVIRKKKDELL